MGGGPDASPEETVVTRTVSGESAFPIAPRWCHSCQEKDHSLGSKILPLFKNKLPPFLPLSKTTYYGEKKKWQVVREAFKLWERVCFLVNLKEEIFTIGELRVSFSDEFHPTSISSWFHWMVHPARRGYWIRGWALPRMCALEWGLNREGSQFCSLPAMHSCANRHHLFFCNSMVTL